MENNILYTQKQIQFAVKGLAFDIAQDAALYPQPPVIICVLNGAVVFYTDLVMNLPIDCEMDFVRVKSYTAKQQRGELRLTKDIEVDIKDKNVYIVDDIYETGNTVNYLVDHLSKYKPLRITPVVLFKRAGSTYDGNTELMHAFQPTKDEWLVGYGLDDDNGLKRNLPYIIGV